MIQLIGLHVLRDFAADQPHFTIFDPPVRLLQREMPCAQAFHLAAHEHNAALQRVEHFVLVAGLAVLGDEALVVVLANGGGFFLAAFSSWFFGRSDAPFSFDVIIMPTGVATPGLAYGKLSYEICNHAIGPA